MRHKILVLLLCLTTLWSCTETNKAPKENLISVSIEPLRYIVEQIAGGDFDVFTVVPDGSSAETYEPTPSALKNVSQSKAFVSVGMLETEMNVIRYIAQDSSVANCTLSQNITLLDEHECGEGEETHHHHHAGGDPHIWLSIANTGKIAETVLGLLKQLNPDSTAKYDRNYQVFTDSIASLAAYANTKSNALNNKTIIVYHPFLGYLGNECGFKQLAIEQDGKEPSAKALKKLIQEAKAQQIDKIFYQSQFSQASIESLSRELNAEKIEINPLAYDHLSNIRNIIEQISR